MYGLVITVWSMKSINRSEVTQNTTSTIALGANRYVKVEANRGDRGRSTFGERLAEAVLRYRIRLQRMDESRWAKKVYEWNAYGQWVGEVGMDRRVIRNGSMDASKKEIHGRVEEKRRTGWTKWMTEKSTIKWYRRIDQLWYEIFYDRSHGGDLLFKGRMESLEQQSV